MAEGDGEAGSQRRLLEGAVRVKEPIRLSQAKRKKKKTQYFSAWSCDHRCLRKCRFPGTSPAPSITRPLTRSPGRSEAWQSLRTPGARAGGPQPQSLPGYLSFALITLSAKR